MVGEPSYSLSHALELGAFEKRESSAAFRWLGSQQDQGRARAGVGNQGTELQGVSPTAEVPGFL